MKTEQLKHQFPCDTRDDFRNGFIAAVTHLRGQGHPTEEQNLAAIQVLHEFRETQQPREEAPRHRWSQNRL